jgi:hypothetical protein
MYLIVSLSKDDSILNYPNLTRIENISANLANEFGHDPKDMIGSTLGNFFHEIKDENLKTYREVKKKIKYISTIIMMGIFCSIYNDNLDYIIIDIILYINQINPSIYSIF